MCSNTLQHKHMNFLYNIQQGNVFEHAKNVDEHTFFLKKVTEPSMRVIQRLLMIDIDSDSP